MRFAVLMHGIIRGMGRQEDCELLATKTVLPDTSHPVYSHCAIIEAPADLPDGEYEVEFASEVAWTRRQNGIWTVGQTFPHSHAELTAFISSNAVFGKSPKPASEVDRSKSAPGEEARASRKHTR